MAVALLTVVMITQERIHTRSSEDVITSTATLDVAPISLDDRVREFEASLIRWALTVSRGNKSQAARLLQVKRSTLGDRINRCGLGGATTQADVADPQWTRGDVRP